MRIAPSLIHVENLGSSRIGSIAGTRFLAVACLALVAVLGFGCASTKPAALTRVKSAADLKSPIGIFVLRTENQYKTNYQSTVLAVRTKAESTGKRTMWRVKKPSEGDKDRYSEYWVSVALEPGRYEIDRVVGQAGDGFLIIGHFDVEPQLEFELPGAGVHYLGRVNLISRERKDGEPRSGPMLPLIDQSVTGYSNSSTDISIEDAAETDVPKFVGAHPALQGVSVSKSIMTQSGKR